MALPKYTQEFLKSQIEYYTSEASSYKQIAEEFTPEIGAIKDTAFGIITGCIYSGFIQLYSSQKQVPSLEDLQEFYKILKEKAPGIKKAMDKMEQSLETISEKPKPNNKKN